MSLVDGIKKYFGAEGIAKRKKRELEWREEELKRLKFKAEESALKKKIRESEK